MRKGFTKIPNDILDQTWATNPTAVYLYTWLALNADKNGKIVTSLRIIAKLTKLSLQQVRTALEKLLSTQVVTQHSTQVTTVLTVSFLATCEDEKIKCNTSSNTSCNTSPNTTSRVYKNEDYNIMSYETEKENSSIEESKKELSFDAFWNLYDKKVGKPKAKKLYEALSDEDRKAIMAHIPLYKQSQPDKQYRKNPETFLRNRSWEDEIIHHATTQTHQRSRDGHPTDEQVVADMLNNIATLNKSGGGEEEIPF